MTEESEFKDAPKEIAPTGPADPDPVKTIEQWCEELATPKWLFAGMKVGKGYPIGKELTRAEYIAALDWAANVPCR